MECLETFFNTWGSFTFRLHFLPLLSRYSRMSERMQHDEQCSSLHDRWRFRYDERCSSLHAEGLNNQKQTTQFSTFVSQVICFCCMPLSLLPLKDRFDLQGALRKLPELQSSSESVLFTLLLPVYKIIRLDMMISR